MIEGIVNDHIEATIRLQIYGSDNQTQEIEAVIDTGFSGFLTLPSSTANSLGLTWIGREQAVLADGSLQLLDVHAATITWDGNPRTIEVDLIDATPLIGMGLLYGHDLHIRAINGGRVTIEALSD